MNYNDHLGYGLIVPDTIPYISILGSPCLVDANSPLRYGLQNAFDGNPATSYVENTDDDLMEINLIGVNDFPVEKMAIINGYSASRTLYQSNNRIKEFNTNNVIKAGDRFEVITDNPSKIFFAEDNELNYQFYNLIFLQEFYVTNMYRGSKYNDTCLAELNVKTNHGWLFGGIEDE
jgi:hypothetical protein